MAVAEAAEGAGGAVPSAACALAACCGSWAQLHAHLAVQPRLSCSRRLHASAVACPPLMCPLHAVALLLQLLHSCFSRLMCSNCALTQASTCPPLTWML